MHHVPAGGVGIQVLSPTISIIIQGLFTVITDNYLLFQACSMDVIIIIFFDWRRECGGDCSLSPAFLCGHVHKNEVTCKKSLPCTFLWYRNTRHTHCFEHWRTWWNSFLRTKKEMKKETSPLYWVTSELDNLGTSFKRARRRRGCEGRESGGVAAVALYSVVWDTVTASHTGSPSSPGTVFTLHH